MGSIKDEYIKQAYEELEKLGDSEEDQERALNREMFIMKLNGIEKAGIEDGKEIGKKKTQLEIAKKMLKENIDIETIVKITELSREEIEKLK